MKFSAIAVILTVAYVLAPSQVRADEYQDCAGYTYRESFEIMAENAFVGTNYRVSVCRGARPVVGKLDITGFAPYFRSPFLPDASPTRRFTIGNIVRLEFFNQLTADRRFPSNTKLYFTASDGITYRPCGSSTFQTPQRISRTWYVAELQGTSCFEPGGPMTVFGVNLTRPGESESTGVSSIIPLAHEFYKPSGFGIEGN